MSDGGGPTVPQVNEPGSSAIGGRGLGIVERLSLRWGTYPSPPSADGASEMTVWAELSLNTEGDLADRASPDAMAHVSAGGHAGETGLVIASSWDA